MHKNAPSAAPGAVEPYMTKAELANYLRVTEKTIENQEKLGLPRVSVGRLPRYDRVKVDAWLTAHSQPSSKRPRGRPRNTDRRSK